MPRVIADSNVRIGHERDHRERTSDVKLSGEDEGITFESLLLSKEVIDGLLKSGFVVPSPIQLKAIPLGRCGVDLIGQAKAGTGKTCVFSVILLEAILPTRTNRVLQAIVLAPTREVATQIHSVVSAIGSCTQINFALFIGGMSMKNDSTAAHLCQVAVGTPGRIADLMRKRVLQSDFVRLLILDEADTLIDSGFRHQINTIFQMLPDRKQVLALSATYPPALAELLGRYMRDPIHVRLNTEAPSLEGVAQHYITTNGSTSGLQYMEKLAALFRLVSKFLFRQCVIFCNSRARACKVAEALVDAGYTAAAITSDHAQQERNTVMQKFRDGAVRMLVSTDLTSRGIDVERVNLVVNLDIPSTPETYLHRIGRTGRFGTKGLAVAVLSESELKEFKILLATCQTTASPLRDNIGVVGTNDNNDSHLVHQDVKQLVDASHAKKGLPLCKWEKGQFAIEGCWAHREGKCPFLHRDEVESVVPHACESIDSARDGDNDDDGDGDKVSDSSSPNSSDKGIESKQSATTTSELRNNEAKSISSVETKVILDTAESHLRSNKFKHRDNYNRREGAAGDKCPVSSKSGTPTHVKVLRDVHRTRSAVQEWNTVNARRSDHVDLFWKRKFIDQMKRNFELANYSYVASRRY